MKAMTITEFKTHALRVLSEIARTKEPVVVTKRGKPIAEVISISEEKPLPGKMSEALVFEKDIVSPLGEEIWNACK